MASLHKLLSEQGFERQISRKPKKKVKFKKPHDSVVLPIFICRDRRSFDTSSLHRSGKAPSARGSSVNSSETSDSKAPAAKTPTKDEPAIEAIVSILSGYVGQYSKDEIFRRNIREKCLFCLENGNTRNSDDEILAHLEMGIESIERLIEFQQFRKEMDLETLPQSIKILKIVASLGSNSELSACAHLYLSIVYKIAKNDKISASRLLKLFSDSPYLARTHLLPELWEHVFLPHLLHIKVWRENELDFLAGLGYADKEKTIEALDEQYDYLMDIGTKKFALYYKDWLKFGGHTPSVPSVPLPSKLSVSRSTRKSSDSSASFHPTSNKSLYRMVIGQVVKSRSMDNVCDLEIEKRVCGGEEDETHFVRVDKKGSYSRRPSSESYRAHKPELWPNSKRSDNYFRFLGCRAEHSTNSIAHTNHMLNNEKIKNGENSQRPHVNDIITRAISTICSSKSLSECEKAVRLITEAWLNSHGDRTMETSLSQASVIQGIMVVLYVSTDDEILELAISLLAELVAKKEVNRLWVLNSDPNLDISIKLFRSSSLFLKAAALLYLIKPKAKQMVSIEWVALVLRVLEFGDHLEILFNVKCYTHEAAYYFLDELLTGFDEDKNLENAQQIVSLGGLSLLVRRMNEGDINEKSRACAVLHCCVKADRSCRYYLAKNLKKDTIISLLALGMKTNSYEHALALMTELLCLSRRSQITECLTGLKKGWDCLNTMHVLIFLLQRARPEERPVVAVILLQLELMDDTSEYSVYREEAIDAIIKALEYRVFDEKFQELSARALLILGGHFSYTGEPEVERWLLRKAGHEENVKSSLCEKDISENLSEDDKAMENWQQRTAAALLTSGNKRLVAALSDSIGNSISCLARASLVTACWISISLHSLRDKELRVAACSILVPRLIECLSDNSGNTEDKILASFSMYNLTKGTNYFYQLYQVEEVLGCLRKLSRATWTARELVSLITRKSSDSF